MSEGSGFGRNFSRDVEAILAAVQIGASLNEVYVYPHEVRENLRRAGMRLDRALLTPSAPNPWELPEDHEPDFGPEIIEDIDPEEDLNV